MIPLIIKEFGTGSKRICIVGCLHGNELIGMEVIKKLEMEDIGFAYVKGIIANEEAIEAKKRFVDIDGNRCFPGRKDGNVEERMAYELLKEIEGFDYVIDIHSTYAEMDDTIIVTKKENIAYATSKVPVKKTVLMPGNEVAKGHSLIDYAKIGISLEFYRERSVAHVTDIVLNLIRNIAEGKNLEVEKELYKVNGFIRKEGVPLDIKNYRLVREGEPLMREGSSIIRSKRDFYPIFFGERGYDGLCMEAVKIASLD